MKKLIVLILAIIGSIAQASAQSYDKVLSMGTKNMPETYMSGNTVAIDGLIFDLAHDKLLAVADTYILEIEGAQSSRWLSMDSYARDYVSISPYTFSLNSPIILLDKDGNVVIDKDGNVVLVEEKDGKLMYTFDPKASPEAIGKFNKEVKPKLDLLNTSNVGKEKLAMLQVPNRRFMITENKDKRIHANVEPYPKGDLDEKQGYRIFITAPKDWPESAAAEFYASIFGVEIGHIQANGEVDKPAKMMSPEEFVQCYTPLINKAVRDRINYRLEKASANEKIDLTNIKMAFSDVSGQNPSGRQLVPDAETLKLYDEVEKRNANINE